jgi:HemY protein
MRTLFWILAIVAVAVALALVADYNTGYVLLIYPPYRIELSLNLMLVLLTAGFFAGYGALRLAVHTLHLPAYVREFRLERRRASGREALVDALLAFNEGRYGKAEKFAAIALGTDESPVVAALLAARAAHAMKAYDKRDGYLTQAERLAPNQATARLMTQAELLLDQRRTQEALSVLKVIHTLAPRLTAAIRLELKAQQQLKNWDQVAALVGQLEKREAIDPVQAVQLKINAYAENLKRKSLDLGSLKDYWQKIPASDRLNSKIALAAARQFLALGECQAATEIIGASLEEQWDSDLVRLFGNCVGKDVLKQIERAENWLKGHGHDAALLLALGRLCTRQELWGKAQSYLEASLSIESTAEAHLALAQLLEKTDRPEEACRHYRESLTSLAGA